MLENLQLAVFTAFNILASFRFTRFYFTSGATKCHQITKISLNKIGAGIALGAGAGVGLAIGTSMGNAGAGLAVGITTGIAFWGNMQKRRLQKR